MKGEILDQELNSGSRWYRWEPHIHAPGTVLNNQFKGPDSWECYLKALEAATPAIRAIGVTDYYSAERYVLRGETARSASQLRFDLSEHRDASRNRDSQRQMGQSAPAREPRGPGSPRRAEAISCAPDLQRAWRFLFLQQRRPYSPRSTVRSEAHRPGSCT